MTKRAVAYIRVSTEAQAQEGYSIDSQRRMLRTFARQHGFEIAKQFEEHESASRPGRPGFHEMIVYLKGHRSVRYVLCYKIDRIARNLKDYSELRYLEGVQIVSATEPLPEGSTGTFLADIYATFSTYFGSQHGERVKHGLEQKARDGYWPVRPPFGYVRRKSGRMIEPEPAQAQMVRDLFEEYAHGKTPLTDLHRWAKDHGLRNRSGIPFARSALHHMLTNPIYCGDVVWNGETHEGRHKPIVARSLFISVQRKLRSGAQGKTSHSFPYRGLLVCGFCGCKITASLAKGKYVYYHCTQGRGKCRQPRLRQERVGELLWRVLEAITRSSSCFELIRRTATSRYKRRVQLRRKRLRELEQKLDVIMARRKAAYEDKLDGAISASAWRDLDHEWQEESEKIRSDLEDIRHSEPESESVDLDRAFELLKAAPTLYFSQSHSERARVLEKVVSNCELRGEKVLPHYKDPFSEIAIELDLEIG